MGFVLRIVIDREKAPCVEKAQKELLDWVELNGGYENFYYPWRLANHLSVEYPETPRDNEMARWIGVDACSAKEAMVFHHDVPWPSQLPREVVAKGKECFEKYGVLDICCHLFGNDAVDAVGNDTITRL